MVNILPPSTENGWNTTILKPGNFAPKRYSFWCRSRNSGHFPQFLHGRDTYHLIDYRHPNYLEALFFLVVWWNFQRLQSLLLFLSAKKTTTPKQASNQAMSADFRIFDSSGPDGFKAWKDSGGMCDTKYVEVLGDVRSFPTHCQFETIVFLRKTLNWVIVETGCLSSSGLQIQYLKRSNRPPWTDIVCMRWYNTASIYYI